MLLVLVVMSVPVLSWTSISKAMHIPQHGDVVDVWRCEMLDVGAAGDGVLWDFSDASVSDESQRVMYYGIGDSLLICNKNGTLHSFLIKNDSICWLGYENRLSFLKASDAPFLMRLPMNYGDSIASPFHLSGNYCGNNAVEVHGLLSACVDAKGTLILPSDTIENVLRLHIKTDGAYIISNDLSRQTSNDSVLDKIVDTYLWYGESFRFPLAEVSVSSIRVKNVEEKSSGVSYLCTPLMQEISLGKSFTKNKPLSPLVGGSESAIIRNLSITTGDGYADLSFTSEKDVEVNLVLADASGRVYAYLPKKVARAGYVFSERIDVSRLSAGNYVLYVKVAEETHNVKFIIR